MEKFIDNLDSEFTANTPKKECDAVNLLKSFYNDFIETDGEDFFPFGDGERWGFEQLVHDKAVADAEAIVKGVNAFELDGENMSPAVYSRMTKAVKNINDILTEKYMQESDNTAYIYTAVVRYFKTTADIDTLKKGIEIVNKNLYAKTLGVKDITSSGEKPEEKKEVKDNTPARREKRSPRVKERNTFEEFNSSNKDSSVESKPLTTKVEIKQETLDTLSEAAEAVDGIIENEEPVSDMESEMPDPEQEIADAIAASKAPKQQMSRAERRRAAKHRR